MEDRKAIYMIEGGRPLALVKEYIEARNQVFQQNLALIEELGATDWSINRRTGVVVSVIFKGRVHPEFTKASGRRQESRPKKGTGWFDRFNQQVGHPDQSVMIQNALGVPTQLNYSGQDFTGSKSIGFPMHECGFLYLGREGPYAMWIPDVGAIVAEHLAEGLTINEPARSFSMELDGCRRIEREEWEILVLQRKLKDKHRGAAASIEGAAA